MPSFWRAAYRVLYRVLAWLDPAIRAFWRRAGIGNVVELRVPDRNGGPVRSRLVGLLHADGSQYIGHPNGDVGWTRDLAAADTAVIVHPNGAEWRFRATRLNEGDERERAIRATSQHPFPGSLAYRLGRGHIRNVGVFFRLENADPGTPAGVPTRAGLTIP